MVRTILAQFFAAGLATLDRCLDRAGDDSDPSLWRLRSGSEAALDVLPRDERDNARDRPHLPTL